MLQKGKSLINYHMDNSVELHIALRFSFVACQITLTVNYDPACTVLLHLELYAAKRADT
jgi:hypothetical protein